MDVNTIEFFRAVSLAFISCFPPALLFFLIAVRLIQSANKSAELETPENVFYLEDYRTTRFRTKPLLKRTP